MPEIKQSKIKLPDDGKMSFLSPAFLIQAAAVGSGIALIALGHIPIGAGLIMGALTGGVKGTLITDLAKLIKRK